MSYPIVFRRAATALFAVNQILLIGSMAIDISLGQTAAPSVTIENLGPSVPSHLPAYVVYRHFLSWVTQLDNAATAAGASDRYQFAQAFSRAGLQNPQLDILRAAAHRLDSDLQAHKAKAQIVITLYRKQAKAALAEGKPLPPAPPVIHQLERERTAILIHHYTNLRASLGPDISKQLDAYLAYEFAPHIKLKKMAAPTAPAVAQAGN